MKTSTKKLLKVLWWHTIASGLFTALIILPPVSLFLTIPGIILSVFSVIAGLVNACKFVDKKIAEDDREAAQAIVRTPRLVCDDDEFRTSHIIREEEELENNYDVDDDVVDRLQVAKRNSFFHNGCLTPARVEEVDDAAIEPVEEGHVYYEEPESDYEERNMDIRNKNAKSSWINLR